MSISSKPILVFGATGRQGGSVARALIESGWPVRAIVRDPASPAASALRDIGVDIQQGSLDDRSAILTAMTGVHGVFLVLPGGLPDGDEVRYGSAIADAAAAIGVEHLVYSSGASAGEELTGVARFDAKPQIEAHVRELPVTATIIRPMIFMEMLLRPGTGLEQGKFSFFLTPDQSMQLVAVDDIGKLVSAIFANEARFAGETLKLASDTVTGRELEEALSEAAGRPISYSRFPNEVLAGSPDLAQMSTSLESGPLSRHADLDLMRELDPELLTLRAWLAGSGREKLTSLLRTPAQAS